MMRGSGAISMGLSMQGTSMLSSIGHGGITRVFNDELPLRVFRRGLRA